MLFFLVITNKENRRHIRGWRPVFLVLLAGLFACGIAAFQILDTLRAMRRSVRAIVSVEQLGAGGFTFSEAFQSFVSPLFNHLETTTYQAPLILSLAVAAVVLLWRLKERRVLFWLVVA